MAVQRKVEHLYVNIVHEVTQYNDVNVYTFHIRGSAEVKQLCSHNIDDDFCCFILYVDSLFLSKILVLFFCDFRVI